MKSLKRATNDFVGTIKSSLNKSFSPLYNHMNDKWRLKGRIRLLNRWAYHNPKKLFISFLLIMAFIMASDFVASSIYRLNNPTGVKAQIIPENNIFDGMRKINENRENLKLYYSKMVEEGQQLTTQLDSLIKKENKSHKDSLEIERIVNQLNVITNILKDEKN